jgi:2-polyprenyl-6-methoxyphenol hydroxylase-like FAD-dependent oxidoreductase
MTSNHFDLVIVGGGIGGSALAKVMAEHGARVLVIEKEREFKDRVRGDAMAPWGVPEARALGIEQLLRETCGHELPWVQSFIQKVQLEHRNLPTTTRCECAELAFYHPAMQEVLLTAAAGSGAVVWRGAVARGLQVSDRPSVTVEQNGGTQLVSGRIVVGADGRLSGIRRMGGFELCKDPDERFIAGVLLEGIPVRHDTSYGVIDPRRGQLTALFPQGNDRVRVYFSYPNKLRGRLQGEAAIPQMVDESIRAGAPAEWYAEIRPVGPLATIASDDHWVDHPYRDGIVLIGDAAAANDPMFGQGLSLTLRDARVLFQHLTRTNNWDEACHAYASEHDGYYQALRTFSHWFESLFYGTGLQADLVRARVFPLLAQDRTRIPDFFFSGPDRSLTETDRRRMFGED